MGRCEGGHRRVGRERQHAAVSACAAPTSKDSPRVELFDLLDLVNKAPLPAAGRPALQTGRQARRAGAPGCQRDAQARLDRRLAATPHARRGTRTTASPMPFAGRSRRGSSPMILRVRRRSFLAQNSPSPRPATPNCSTASAGPTTSWATRRAPAAWHRAHGRRRRRMGCVRLVDHRPFCLARAGLSGAASAFYKAATEAN